MKDELTVTPGKQVRIFLEAEVKVRVILVNNFVVKGLKVYALSFFYFG